MKKLIGVILVSLFLCISHGATTIEAKVLSVGTYGSGRLFVVLDTMIGEPGCNYAQFHVEVGHDQIKNWMSIGLAALSSGNSVTVTTEGCLGAYPTMTNTQNTNFRMSAN